LNSGKETATPCNYKVLRFFSAARLINVKNIIKYTHTTFGQSTARDEYAGQG
jgi:hypothetical protein